ncbi:MAG: hypothetical protein DIU52_003405, partial [bacterium]
MAGKGSGIDSPGRMLERGIARMRRHSPRLAGILAAAISACSAETNDDAATAHAGGSGPPLASSAADTVAAVHDAAAAPAGDTTRPAAFPFPLPYIADAE